MSDQACDISVVICAYTEQRWSELVKAVASVRNQTLPPCEIVLVIDHNPRLALRVRRAWFDVIVVENRQTRGLSGARNSGIAVTQGEIIAFIDEDATAAPDWLAQLSDHYREPAVLGVGGTIEPAWQADRPSWFPVEFDWVVGCTYRGMPATTRAVRNLVGCNMSFRHEVFQEVGGFRSEIGRIRTRPMGCEETEFCIRLNQLQPHGLLLYEPRAKVRHQVPVERANWHYFIARCYAEGLSKAIVARFVGAQRSLSSERTYAFHTLPRGILRGVTDAIVRRDLAGLLRAAAIGIGLAATTLGYVWTMLSLRLGNKRASNSPVIVSGESTQA